MNTERVLRITPRELTMILAIAELALVAGVGTYVWRKLIKRWAETGKRW